MAIGIFHTSCCECWVVCGALAHVDEKTKKIVAVVGDVENPLNKGYLCPGGRVLPSVFTIPIGSCIL